MTATQMVVNLSRLHFPVSSLGYGQRVAVWFQGCSLQCPGCVSQDTWEHGLGAMPLEGLVEQIARWSDAADGLTVSGGEPFEQPGALRELLLWWRQQQGGDVLVFSGLSWELLQSTYPDILALIDVLVSDPFEAGAGQTLPLRGSDNQRLHCLTPLGQERYQQIPEERVLDVCLDGDKVWLAGIPRPGDLAKLRSQLQGLGLELSTSDLAGCMP